MYISRVELINFRGIEHLELHLDQKCTVFFGINGVGKSSVLSAIDLLYANIISGLTRSKKQLAKLDEDDIMSGKSRAMIIESKLDFRSLFEWFRYREDIENQEKVRNHLDYEDRDIKAVKMAMSAILDGFGNIHIEREPLALMIEKDGKGDCV